MGQLAGRGLPSRLGKPKPGRLHRAAATTVAGDSGDHDRSQNWLHTKRWQDLRLMIIKRDGVRCQGCAVPHYVRKGRKHPDSAVVDHKIPHRGDEALFWDESNLQTVCKRYHDQIKQSLEKRGLA